jgi:hypothetical protein
MAGFNDWISFDPAPMSALERAQEVDDEAHAEIAKRAQTRLRARVDPGVRLQDAFKAQAIRVNAEGGRLVIDEDDQGDVLRDREGEQPEEDDDSLVNDVMQLFEPSSGVPKIVNGQLTYRQISLRALFGEQKKDEQDRVVEGVLHDTIQSSVVDAYEQATNTIGQRYPSK